LTPAGITAVEVEVIDLTELVHFIAGDLAALGAYPLLLLVRRNAAKSG
jgi:hypothetical protein